MSKKMLINATHPEECRVAVVSDGILEELDVEVTTHESTLGNIYKAKVCRIEPSLQALFVDYGSPRNGFLSINDVHPSYFPESFEEGRRRPRVQDVFEKGDDVLVQVSKEERDHKGACLTTNLSIAGRYLVLMPGTDLMAVSRKIANEDERKKLRDILKQFHVPSNMGFIVRTAGQGRTKAELSRDLSYLLKLWQAIETNMNLRNSPDLLYREQDVVIRSIRDYFSRDISEILVDDKEVFKKARDFLQQIMPRYKNRLKLHQEKRPLFNKYQLEEQVEDVYHRRINLKSGGYIIIEPTEALVTVDVNSGSATKEKDIEGTAFRVNLEAAGEIGRQLRLRDLGGIIVIDFIDMMNRKHKVEVEKALKASLKTDRAKTKVLKISTLGLLELSRQRLKPSLGTGEYLDCPLCNGQGRVRSPEMTAVSVFRKIKSLVIKTDVAQVNAVVPSKVAEYLLNDMRSQIVDIEDKYRARVIITGENGLSEKGIVLEAVKESSPLQAELDSADTDSDDLEPPSAENGAVAEEDKKRPRKPSRRRRRPSRRKTSVEGPDDARSGESGSGEAADESSSDSGYEASESENGAGKRRQNESDLESLSPTPVGGSDSSSFKEVSEESSTQDLADQEATRKKKKGLFPALRDLLPFS